LACAGHGRAFDTESVPVKSFANMLLSSNPEAAWQVAGTGPKLATLKSTSGPARRKDTSMQLESVEEYEGAAQETNEIVWDPLGLSDLGSPATLAWFRHAELKHGRVAMAAFVGWLVAASHMHFPGQLSFNQVPITFEEISKLPPMDQWVAVPELGKLQILLAIGTIEHNSEWKIKPHYMKGGVPGSLKGLKKFWDPIGFTNKMGEDKLKRTRLAELKNSRLAMIGIISVLVGSSIPGSIPLVSGLPEGGKSLILPFGPTTMYR